MRRVVLVNGVPASGKSTVARELAARLFLPIFGIDTVKEALFVHLGTGDRDHNRLLGRASYEAIFATIAVLPSGMTAIVDAWHGFQPRETVAAILARAGVATAIEIWCYAPPEVLAERYRRRAGARHPGHPPLAYAQELEALATRARALGFATVTKVDTHGPVDYDALARAVTGTLDQG